MVNQKKKKSVKKKSSNKGKMKGQSITRLHLGTTRLENWVEYCERERKENPSRALKIIVNAAMPPEYRVNEGIQFKK